MATLSPLEVERLKLLLSGKTLITEEQVSTLDILRSRFSNFFSNLEPGLTKENLKDNNFLIKYLSNPHNRNKIKNALRSELSLSPTQQIDLEQALSEEPVAAEEVGEQPISQETTPATDQLTQPTGAAGSSAGGMPFGGMPSIPSIPSAPRRVFVTQQTLPPGGKEGGTGQGIAATNKIDRLEIEKVGAATAKSDRLNAQTATLQTETQSTPLSKPNSAEVSNLRSTVPQRFNFSAFRSSAGSSFKKFQNFASPAGRFFQNTIGKHLTGDRAMKLLGKAGRTGMDALSGINNLGGGGGGGGFSTFGRFGRNGNGRGFLDRFGKGGGQGKSLAGKAKGRGGLIFAGGIIGFMLLVGGIAMTAPSPTPGQAAPTNNPNSSNNWGLDYTLPLKNTSIQPLDIKSQITAAFPGAKLEYWDTIVQASITNGFNPALALALWIEETGASQATLLKNGGSEIVTNGSLSKGHLGCAPKEDQTIDESLTCLFKFVAANNFADGQFAQFMALYSGGPTSAPFSNNPNFPKNIKDWYTKLVPSGVGAITAVTPSSAPQQPFVTSCPIPGGKITCGSSRGVPGVVAACHCTASYSPSCPPESRRGKAIDVTGPNGSKDNDPVYLPLIKGRALKWYFRGDYNDDEGATLRVFQSEPTTDGVWTIHFVHSKRRTDLLKTGGDFTAVPVFSNGQEITDLTQPVAYIDKSSGIGEIGTHTHVSIGIMGNDWETGNLQYNNSGWKYADAEMNMCL